MKRPFTFLLLLLATVLSEHLIHHEDCKIRFLSNRVTPTRLNYNVTKLVRDIGSKLLRNPQVMNFSLASRALLLMQADISGVIFTKVDERILALNINSRMRIFPNRTAETDVFWKSFDATEEGWGKPFKDCSFFSKSWFYVFAYRMSALKIGLFINLPLNQCDDSIIEIFGAAHKCGDSQMCVSEHDMKTEQKGRYRCVCQPGFFYPGAKSSWTGIRGEDLENGKINSTRCQPCPRTCPDSCSKNGVCLVRQDSYLKACIIIVQLVSMGFVIFLALVVFKQRKTKAIATGMWTILEIILLGIFILYLTVVIRSLEPSLMRCLLEPWVREIGFIICYGAIILKMYRHLIEFRTRKAHRWEQTIDTEEQTDYNSQQEENNDEIKNVEEINVAPQSSTVEIPAKRLKNQGRLQHSLMEDALALMKTASSKLKAPLSDTPDEVKAFGNYIVSKMKSYSEKTRRGVEHAFYNILIKADTGYFETSLQTSAQDMPTSHHYLQQNPTQHTSSPMDVQYSSQSTPSPRFTESLSRHPKQSLEIPSQFNTDQRYNSAVNLSGVRSHYSASFQPSLKNSNPSTNSTSTAPSYHTLQVFTKQPISSPTDSQYLSTSTPSPHSIEPLPQHSQQLLSRAQIYNSSVRSPEGSYYLSSPSPLSPSEYVSQQPTDSLLPLSQSQPYNEYSMVNTSSNQHAQYSNDADNQPLQHSKKASSTHLGNLSDVNNSFT